MYGDIRMALANYKSDLFVYELDGKLQSAKNFTSTEDSVLHKAFSYGALCFLHAS